MMKKFKSKTIKKVVAMAMAVAVTAVSVPNFFERMTVEASASTVNFDEENIAMSFAVLSDLHLHKSGDATATNVQAQVQRYANAVATLNQMAVNSGNGLDMLLLAGDYGDTATEVEGRAFASATKQILEQLETVNQKDAGVIFAYGNHETQVSASVTNAMTYEQWETVLGEYGLVATAKDANDAYVPWGCNHETVVKTVDGEEKTYHFFSLEIYSYASNFIRVDALEWLDKELEAATTADPDAYVYLACHAPTRESGVYGADENFDPYFWWGSTRDDYRATSQDGVALSGGLHSVLKKYPQVVQFSGHYHYTNLLESTIMSNGDYTAVAMAALSDSAIANGASQDNGYQDNVSAYNQTQVDKGYGLLVEVDKDGNQRMTRLEIDRNCSNMVKATVTYQANDAETTIAEDKYTADVSFAVSNAVQPTTLTPWVMNAPTEDKSHLDTYTQATRKGTPAFPEGAKLALENIVINEDDSVNFDITYDTVGAKKEDTNWVIRYELELYNQDGELLNAGKTVRRLKDDRTAFYTVRKDSIWMLGNFAANTDGVVDGTNHLNATKLSYPYSLSAEDLSGVTGIYAKLYAVDEFGGKSAPLTYGSKTQLVNVGPILKNGGFENGNLTNWFDETTATPVKEPTKVTVNYSFSNPKWVELYFTFATDGDLSSLKSQSVSLLKNETTDVWTLSYVGGYFHFAKQHTPAENDVIQIPKGLQITCNGETYEIAEDFAVKFDGSSWAKCDATPTEEVVGPIAAVTDEKRSGEYSLKIEREDTAKKFVRTDINSISPETEYKLTYYINTDVMAAVEATIYEYSFNNKIVGRHQVEVYGATSDWKKGELTFTTSAGADKLGLILTAKGSAGVIYVDDVKIEAQEAEKIQFSYDDSNGDGDFNIKDIVRMKSALTNGKDKLATPKYADRNGDGAFDGGDTAALRAKALGVADDFTNVLVTDGDIEAFGAKLQSDSGSAFMATGKKYSNQTFTFTTEYQAGLKLAVRMPEGAPGGFYDKTKTEGLIIALQTGYAGFYMGNAYNNVTAQSLYSYTYGSQGTLVPGETYVFSVNMTDNADGTMKLYLEARQNSVLVAQLHRTFTVEECANVPKEGQFIVWAQKPCQEMLYQVVETENPTRVVVDGNKGQDGVVTLNKDATTGMGYLVLDGDYSTEHYRFTTSFDFETITGETGLGLFIGVNKQDSTSTNRMSNGLTIQLDGARCTSYICNNNTNVQHQTRYWSGTLQPNVEYTFDIQVTGKLMIMSIYRGTTLHSTVTIGASEDDYKATTNTSYTVYDKGAFILYTTNDNQKFAWDMPEKDPSAVEIDASAAGSAFIANSKPGDLANSAYVVTKDTYTTEVMEFTTVLQEVDTMIFGTRMAGKSHNPASYNGLYVQFTEDGTGYTVYNKGTSIATGTLTTALEAGKEYTFRLMTDKTLGLVIWQGDTEIHNTSIALTGVANVPAEGYFMVWSMEPYQSVDYSMAMSGGSAVVIPEGSENGTAIMYGKSGLASGEMLSLELDGDYTTETASFTMTFSAEANHFIGARMTDVKANPTSSKGIVVKIASFGAAYVYVNGRQLTKSDWTADTTNSQDFAWFFGGRSAGTYTYAIKIENFEDRGTSRVVVTETLPNNEGTWDRYSPEFASSLLEEESGSFAVWTGDEGEVEYTKPN